MAFSEFTAYPWTLVMSKAACFPFVIITVSHGTAYFTSSTLLFFNFLMGYKREVRWFRLEPATLLSCCWGNLGKKIPQEHQSSCLAFGILIEKKAEWNRFMILNLGK